MGWLSVLLNGIAAFLFFKSGNSILMSVAIIAAIGCLWSWGVMHNYTTEFAKRRAGYSGKFFDLSDQEAQSVPDWITRVNIIFTLAGVILLIIGIVMVVIR